MTCNSYLQQEIKRLHVARFIFPSLFHPCIVDCIGWISQAMASFFLLTLPSLDRNSLLMSVPTKFPFTNLARQPRGGGDGEKGSVDKYW